MARAAGLGRFNLVAWPVDVRKGSGATVFISLAAVGGWEACGRVRLPARGGADGVFTSAAFHFVGGSGRGSERGAENSLPLDERCKKNPHKYDVGVIALCRFAKFHAESADCTPLSLRAHPRNLGA